MQDLNIRVAQSLDTERIAQIYNHYLGDGTMDLEEKTGLYFQRVLEKQTEKERFYVLEFQKHIVGWGQIKKYSDRMGYQFAAETSVYLDPDFLGRGWGTLLKKIIIADCKKLTYKHLVAKIWERNKISILYNQKLGYEIVGIQKAIGFVDGQWIDVVIMQLVL